MGICEPEGSILSLSVHSGLAIDPLQLEVWPIIIWLVISRVTSLEDEGFDVVGAEYMNGPVVKMAVMAIIEEDLWIELVFSKGSLEMHHCLHPTTPVHIPRWCIVDYPVFRNVVVEILCVFCCLTNYHRWHEAMSISSDKNESCELEGGSLSGLGPPHPVPSE